MCVVCAQPSFLFLYFLSFVFPFFLFVSLSLSSLEVWPWWESAARSSDTLVGTVVTSRNALLKRLALGITREEPSHKGVSSAVGVNDLLFLAEQWSVGSDLASSCHD